MKQVQDTQSAVAAKLGSTKELHIPIPPIPWSEVITTIGGLLSGKRKKRRQIAVVNTMLQEVTAELARLQIFSDSLGEWQRFEAQVKKAIASQSWTTKAVRELEFFIADKTAQTITRARRSANAIRVGVSSVQSYIKDNGVMQEAQQSGVWAGVTKIFALIEPIEALLHEAEKPPSI